MASNRNNNRNLDKWSRQLELAQSYLRVIIGIGFDVVLFLGWIYLQSFPIWMKPTYEKYVTEFALPEKISYQTFQIFFVFTTFLAIAVLVAFITYQTIADFVDDIREDLLRRKGNEVQARLVSIETQISLLSGELRLFGEKMNELTEKHILPEITSLRKDIEIVSQNTKKVSKPARTRSNSSQYDKSRNNRYPANESELKKEQEHEKNSA